MTSSLDVLVANSVRVALCLGLVTAGSVLAPSSAVAQEPAARYVGTLGGGNSGCPLNSQAIEVEIRGTKVSGFWVESSSVKPKFAGEMAGSSFKIIREAKSGNQSAISGELTGGNLEVRFVGPKCSYRGVLKKQA